MAPKVYIFRLGFQKHFTQQVVSFGYQIRSEFQVPDTFRLCW